LKGKAQAIDRLHVTLNFLDKYLVLPADLSAIAAEAGAAVRSQSFELCFERMLSFDSARRRQQRRGYPLVLLREDSAPLRALREQISLAVARTGRFPRAEQSATPHVTLLYDRKLVNEQEVARVCWTAREFVLVHSLHGLSENRVLARYALH
jgi:2'-5' RNA ligase